MDAQNQIHYLRPVTLFADLPTIQKVIRQVTLSRLAVGAG